MMGPCCVEGCTGVGTDSVYFEFPTSRGLRRKWLEMIKIPHKVPLGTVVCLQHFKSDDYMTVRGKVRLKSKVVPTLKLYNISSTSSPSPEAKTKSLSETNEKLPDETMTKEILPEEKTENKEVLPEVKTENKKVLPEEKTENKVVLPEEKTKNQEVLPEVKIENQEVLPDKNMVENVEILPQSDSTTEKSSRKVRSSSKEKSRRDNKRSEEICKVIRKNKEGSNKSDIRLLPDLKQQPDFEDMITNYQIKNSKPNTLLQQIEIDIPPMGKDDPHMGTNVPHMGTNVPHMGTNVPHMGTNVPHMGTNVPNVGTDETIELDGKGDEPPVFIEISVDKDTSTANANSQDCLMVLESVQVEVDPATLLLAERDYDEADHDQEDGEVEPKKKENPISLLTSSDEDDVILEEPEIDTVEVSDATDEDDIPLTKLIKKKPEKKKITKKKIQNPLLGKMDDFHNLVWAGNYSYFCYHCHFKTHNSAEYGLHLRDHHKILQVCPICNFSSASKTQFSRHTRKHKEEKKFKCPSCEYRARHKMSLIYHMQNHEKEKKAISLLDDGGYKCNKCDYKSGNKTLVLRHSKNCGVKVFQCELCLCTTKRRSDMKRHMNRKHSDRRVSSESDVNFTPVWD